MKLAFLCCTFFAAALPFALHAAEPTYPTKPIRLVIGSPAGGSTDILARLVGQKLNESMGHPVIVDPRPGASGLIAGELVARGNPDGYTLLLPSLQHVINGSLFRKITFDAINEYSPVAQIANVPMFVVVHPSLPVKSVNDLIALAKAKPGALSFSSSGIGTPQHLGMEMLNRMAKLEMVHIPFKGAADSIAEILAGRVPVGIITVPPGLPHVKTGKLVAIASAGAKRIQVLPDLPTIAQAGLPGFAVDNWIGLLAPPRTPKPIVDKLYNEIVRLVALPDVRERMAIVGFDPSVVGPAEFHAIMKTDGAKYAKVAKDIGARLD